MNSCAFCEAAPIGSLCFRHERVKRKQALRDELDGACHAGTMSFSDIEMMMQEICPHLIPFALCEEPECLILHVQES